MHGISKFVIISFPRSGSGFLRTSLNSNPKIACDGEIFHPDSSISLNALSEKSTQHILSKSFSKFKRTISNERKLLVGLLSSNPEKFLKEFYVSRNDVTALGFKIFFGHQDEILTNILKNENVKKIILTRQNMIRSYVSELIALKSNIWISKSGSNPLTKVKVDPNKLTQYVQSNMEKQDYVRNQIIGPSMWLDYETITKDKFDPKELITFIDKRILNETFSSPLKKQNPFSLPDMITNYSELIDSISDQDLLEELQNETI